jgi:hypothetical protein
LVSSHLKGESDEEGKIYLRKKRIANVFVYDANTFEKIQPTNIDLENGVIIIDSTYRDVEVDFQYYY